MFELLIAEIARARAEERMCGIPTPVFARRRSIVVWTRRGRLRPLGVQTGHADVPGPSRPRAACAAASRAIGTRYGEHDT
jgi:hypothetical protein